MSIKLLGEVIAFDPITSKIQININFLDLDARQEIETLLKEKNLISLIIAKAYKSKKTTPQLKRYYAMITRILVAMEIFPSAENIKTFDEEVVKRKIANCEYLEIGEERIPVIKSKRDWEKEEMKEIMEKIQDRYSYLNINWENEDWYKEED
jgi:hypothetical protein